jgi:hypothetical protein
MHPIPDMSSARRALRRVLSENRFTATEIAEIAGSSLSSIHKAASVSEDASDLSAARWEIIARWLCEHGERRVSMAYVSPDCVITRIAEDAGADGRVDDELRSLLEVGGRISAAHRSRDEGTMSGAIEELDHLLSRLRAEGALLR